MLTFVARELRGETGRASGAYLYLLEPTALLIAAYSLWRVRPLGDAVAILASGWVVYSLLVDIVWSIATYDGVPVLSGRAMKKYWTLTFAEWQHYPDRPSYFMLVPVAVLILSYSLASIMRTFVRRSRASAHVSGRGDI